MAVNEFDVDKKSLMETLFEKMRPKMEDKEGKIDPHVVDVLDVKYMFNGELKKYNKKMAKALAGRN